MKMNNMVEKIVREAVYFQLMVNYVLTC